MHESAYNEMRAILAGIRGEGLRVLDVGSLDVNGSYRPLVAGRGWSYTGLDMRPGKNVDVVSDDPFRYQFEDNRFDIVISGSTMEHVTRIWDWVPELVRVLKPGGWLVILTHWQFPEHRYPLDCWRIMPDGMRFLFEREPLDIDRIQIINDIDIVGVARKREG